MFKSWTKSELLWLIGASLFTISLPIYLQDTLIGILSAFTGVVAVILAAKGNIYCHYWGVINCTLYAYVSFQNGYYGETILNLLFHIPMHIIGYFTWRNNMNADKDTVIPKPMSAKVKTRLLIIGAITTATWGFCLQKLNSNMPYISALCNVLSLTAQLSSVKRYAEQWLFWIALNCISVGLWVTAMQNGSQNIGTLLMWLVYVVNSIWGFIKWKHNTYK